MKSVVAEKSPWNPSCRATARVLNPLPAPTMHDACGGAVQIEHHTQVYGRAYSEWPWLYRCRQCDATVGMHPFTAIPLGTLADKTLRKARTNAKTPFERIWQSRLMTRSEVYAALAQHLGISINECHFGWFDARQCVMAGAWAKLQLGETVATTTDIL